MNATASKFLLQLFISNKYFIVLVFYIINFFLIICFCSVCRFVLQITNFFIEFLRHSQQFVIVPLCIFIKITAARAKFAGISLHGNTLFQLIYYLSVLQVLLKNFFP